MRKTERAGEVCHFVILALQQGSRVLRFLHVLLLLSLISLLIDQATLIPKYPGLYWPCQQGKLTARQECRVSPAATFNTLQHTHRM